MAHVKEIIAQTVLFICAAHLPMVATPATANLHIDVAEVVIDSVAYCHRFMESCSHSESYEAYAIWVVIFMHVILSGCYRPPAPNHLLL